MLGGLEAPTQRQPLHARSPARAAPTPDWFVAVNDRDPTQMALTQLVELYVLGAVNANTSVWRVDDPTRRRPFDFPEIAAALHERGIEPTEPDRRSELPSFTDEEAGDERTVIASPSLRERFPDLGVYSNSISDEADFDERTVAMDQEALLRSYSEEGARNDDNAGLGVARLPDDPEFAGLGGTGAEPQVVLAVPATPVDGLASRGASPAPPPPPPSPITAPQTPRVVDPINDRSRSAGQPTEPQVQFASASASQAEQVQSDDENRFDEMAPNRRTGCGRRALNLGLVAALVLACAVVALYLYDRNLIVQYVPQLRGFVPSLFPQDTAPVPFPSATPSPSSSDKHDRGVGAGGAAGEGEAAASAKATAPKTPGAFDQQAMLKALAAAEHKARKCYDAEAGIDGGRVVINFEPTGRVSNVVPKGQLAGNKVGLCVAGYFKEVRIPPFAGEGVPVAHRVSLR